MQQFRPTSFDIAPVVKYLLIINIIFFISINIIPSALGNTLYELLALYFPSSSLFKPFQYITHLFMHANFLHLFSNMFALIMFGSILERRWGSKRFLIFYFVCGLGAAMIYTLSQWYDYKLLQDGIDNYKAAPGYDTFLAFYNNYSEVWSRLDLSMAEEIMGFLQLWSSDMDNTRFISQSLEYAQGLPFLKSMIACVGASGAIFGLLIAFAMYFPNTYLYISFIFPIKVKYFIAIYILFELYAGFNNNPTDNVAHFAHLGGVLVGFLMVKYWNNDRTRLH